jgi:hypothetical protein
MDALIWYSWLGGVIIGTMIGANWVLEDYCREGPRNVVITGRYIHSMRILKLISKIICYLMSLCIFLCGIVSIKILKILSLHWTYSFINWFTSIRWI